MCPNDLQLYTGNLCIVKCTLYDNHQWQTGTAFIVNMLL